MNHYLFTLVVFAVLVGVKSIDLSEDVLRRLAPGEDDNTLSAFLSFVKTYEKVYEISEVVEKLNIYKLNTEIALKLNKASQKLGGANFGETVFSDLTQEEFENTYLMKNFQIPKELLEDDNHKNVTVFGAVPTDFDWTSKGIVTGVYDQGACGSCWAFAATENLESVYAIKHGGPVRSLSPQQIVSCDSPATYACNGGYHTQAWTYIHDQGGLDLWQCYPYVGVAEACKFSSSCVGANVIQWNWVFQKNENSMATWLSGNAPIAICLAATNWQFYTGGVLLESQCPSTPQSDHCVLITGYNLNNNPPFWNIRNSWGTAWGESGYIRLQYGTDTCGVAYYPASVTNC